MIRRSFRGSSRLMQRDKADLTRTARPRTARPRTAGVRALPMVCVLTALGLMVLAANSMGRFSAGSAFEILPPPAPVISQPPTDPVPVDTPAVQPSMNGSSDAVVLVVAAVFVVLAVVVLVVILRRLRSRAADGSDTVPGGMPAIVVLHGDDLPQLRDAFAQAEAALAGSQDSCDAIILCWLALESGADRAGLPRRMSETSTEFTAALLNRFHPQHADTATLLGLYQRARFGVTEQQRRMDPADLESARTALASLRRSLDPGDGVRAAAP